MHNRVDLDCLFPATAYVRRKRPLSFWGIMLMRSRLLIVLALAFASPAVTLAQDLRDVGKYGNARDQLLKKQTDLLDGKLSKQYRASSKYRPDKPKISALRSSSSIPAYRGKYRGIYLTAAKAAAQRHGIPQDLFLRLVQQESGFNPKARSHKGAIGLAQLMPATARQLGVDPHDPKQNLEGGARYLAQMYRKFGSWRLALAAYNAGPGAVEKHNGVPPYRETKNYVKVILGG